MQKLKANLTMRQATTSLVKKPNVFVDHDYEHSSWGGAGGKHVHIHTHTKIKIS